MATIADLNVRLGVINDISKGLARAERDLRRSGQRMASLGSELSVAISAPLGLIGVSAIKAAGDLESLELALKSQLGSAEAARKELELLRQSALAPGLGFEQAVRGSVTLQAVGLSAEEARKTIEQFGNGLAIAGKGAAELDGVIMALSQISSKGIVSAEEINQIAERLPQIRTLMQQAFGTSNTENLQKLGISSEDFIRKITSELEKLPRATGGIKNSIENAGDAIKQFLGNLGQEINKTFDLTKVAEELSKSLKGAAQAFSELDADTKKAIITAGAFLIALGPVIKILGVIQLTLAQGAGLLGGFAGALKSVAAAAIFAANNIRLSLAVATGGLLAVLAAVTAAVFYFSDALNSTAFAERAFADATKSVTEQTAEQTAALNANFAVLLNTNSGYDDRKKAIDKLQAAYPEYLKGIDLEKKSNVELEQIQNRVNKAILQGVAERQKAAAVNKIYEEQAKILLRIAEIQRTNQVTVSESTLIDTGDLIRNGSRAAAVIEKLKAQVDGLGKQATTSAADFDKAFGLQGRAIDLAATKEADLRQAYQDREEAAREAAVAGLFLKTSTDEVAKSAKQSESEIKKETAALKEQSRARKEEIEQLKNLTGASLAQQPDLNLRGKTIPEITTEFGVEAEPSFGVIRDGFFAIQDLAALTSEKLTSFGLNGGAAFDAIRNKVLTFGEAFTLVSESARQTGDGLTTAALSISEALQSYAVGAESTLKGYVSALASATKQIVKSFIQQGVAAAVSNSLKSPFFIANPAVGLALAGAVGGAAAALFGSIISKIKLPALAQGGLAFGPTTAIVGDNPGARANPEVIAPLDKLKQYLRPQEAQGGIVAELVLRGQDLLVVMKRAELSNQRLTGAR